MNRSPSREELESFEDEQKIRKYESHAKDFIYRIPIYRPTPSYIVYRNDLIERLNKKLQWFDVKQRDELLKTAVGKIFENINDRYFIQSVKCLLKVELRE